MRELTPTELLAVAGGKCGCGCDCDDKNKGNNGWGNGAEGLNAGSYSGGIAGSKGDEAWSDGDGPAPARFTER